MLVGGAVVVRGGGWAGGGWTSYAHITDDKLTHLVQDQVGQVLFAALDQHACLLQRLEQPYDGIQVTGVCLADACARWCAAN